MAEEPVTLEFIGRHIVRLTNDVAEMRDEIRVQGAILLRVEQRMDGLELRMESMDARLRGIEDQMRAMTRQHQRFNDRLRALEDENR